jgi:hypothetical protein
MPYNPVTLCRDLRIEQLETSNHQYNQMRGDLKTLLNVEVVIGEGSTPLIAAHEK